jgi:ABC-type uncharacterized transport system substrate-binding protein
MTKQFISVALCAMLFALCSSTSAQQPKKLPVIGFLGAAPSIGNDRTDAFRQGMRELGYVEGKNIVIEWRFAERKRDRLPSLAAELVRLKVDVIVTGGGQATRAAKKVTSTIPIVMAQSTDPVAAGFVASLAHPGGNITGLCNLAPELNGKRLELLKEIIPRLSRVAVFSTSTMAGSAQSMGEIETIAAALGMKLQQVDIVNPKDIAPAFQAAVKGQADAVLVLAWGAVVNPYRAELAKLAVKSRLPAIYQSRQYVEAGGLMTYGVSEVDLNRRAAIYVDKILRGAKPADLSVELPTKFDLVINLKTAKALGLKIPAELLMEADKVIE